MKKGLCKLISLLLILSLLTSMVMATGSIKHDPSDPPATEEPTDPTEGTTEPETPEDPTEPEEEPTEPEEDPSEEPTEPEEDPSEEPTESEEDPSEEPTESEEPSEDPTEPEDPSEDPTESEDPSEEPTESEEPSEDPTEPEDPSEDPTEPEKPTYIFPDDWSRPALEFAVENGILQGDQNYNLNPEKNITRVQMAAVLVRLLGATGTADLSNFEDVDPNAWYVKELSAAIAAGIFNGTSATKFSPDSPLTREQAMVVLSRAFGIVTEDTRAYIEFTDGDSVAEYARYAVGAMKEMELVNGYTDGSVKPQKTITRAEVAQLLFKLFDTIAGTPEEIPEEGRILYRGTDPLPTELTLNGTLILANGTPKDLNVENWNIEDTLVIRTEDGIDLDLSGLTANRLVVCAAGVVTSSIDRVWLGGAAGNGVAYTGDATYLGSLLGSHSAKGNYDNILLRGGFIAIDGNARYVEMNPNCGISLNSSCDSIIAGQKCSISLEGSCNDSAFIGSLSTIDISGACESLTVEDFVTATVGGDCIFVNLGNGSQATIGGNCGTITLAPSAQISVGGNCEILTTDILAQVAIGGYCHTVDLGANSVLELGGDSEIITMNGFSKVTAKGHVKAVTMAAEDTLVLDGTADEITVNGGYTTLSGTGRAKLITIYARGCNNTLATDTVNNIWYDTYGREYENALSTVQTMRVACTVLRDTFLCGNQNLTNYLCALPKGAIVYNEWHPAGDVFKVSYTDKNGKTWQGWTDRWACDIPDDTITTNGSLDYSDATKEGWVDAKGYDSATDYLVWVSRYTQKVIVFQGSKGNWKVVKTMPCSSGANNTPTPAGSFTIYSRTGRWDFTNYYTSHVSIFNGGHAFHSILYNYNHTVYDDRVGIPLSHGCIRMLVDDCKYIYNLPLNTRVIVW